MKLKLKFLKKQGQKKMLEFARQYPAVFDAAQSLATKAKSMQENEINVLASFGKLQYEGRVPIFNCEMNSEVYSSIEHLLQMGRWQSTSDWKLKYRYFLKNDQDILNVEDGIVTLLPQKPHSTTLTYQAVLKKQVNTLLLHNYVLGIEMAEKIPVAAEPPTLVPFSSVSATAYKTFTHQNAQQGTTHFMLCHTWQGPSVMHLENAMLHSNSEPSFQVQLCGLRTNMAHDVLVHAFGGLLMKMEDFLVFPELIKNTDFVGPGKFMSL